MAEDVERNLTTFDELDFVGWNNADWEGVFARSHTEDVLVQMAGTTTHGLREHIEAMKAMVQQVGSVPQITAHPIKFGSGEWTCVVGQSEGGALMVTVAKWRDGAIAEEYIWT